MSKTNKKIRIVHYGIGHDHSPQFLACLKQYPDVFEIVGICEPNPEMQKLFSEFRVYDDIPKLTEEEMFALPDIDAAIVEAYIVLTHRAIMISLSLQRAYRLETHRLWTAFLKTARTLESLKPF